VTIDIVLEKVLSLPVKEGFLLDGFPRNRNQAEALEKALGTRSRGLDRVVYTDVPEAELVRRLGGRFICRRCQAPHSIAAGAATTLQCQHCGGELYQRADDAPAAVRQRIQVYQQETLPVLDFYRQQGLLVEISGVGGISEVNRRVLEALGWNQAPVP
jgi:adenylate kinase